VRIAVLNPQTAFVRGGAEIHTEALTQALRDAGHDAEIVTIAGKWYLATEIVHQMAVWRSFDITESNGMRIDAVIALKFPAYLASHDRKIVWLIHQHRSAYELWDHPDFGDLSVQEDGATVRDLIHTGDRLALGEAKRIFANSKNVAKRLWDGLQIPAEPLYHPSPATTQGEAEFAGRLASKYHWHSVVIVTIVPQDFRARLRLERCFGGQVYVMTGSLPLRSWPYQIAYEWGATIKALTVFVHSLGGGK